MNDYNEENVFNFDLSLEDRLDKYITKYFYIAKIISNLAQVYLVGGAIRDLMYGKFPKDFDFVVLRNSNKEFILQVFEKFNIKYELNKLGGFKINYNNMMIDIWTTEDLFESIQYNLDGLLYNLNSKMMISLTFDDFKNNGLIEINHRNNIQNKRITKLKKFESKYLK